MLLDSTAGLHMVFTNCKRLQESHQEPLDQSPLWQESFLEGLWVASFSAYPRPPFCPTVKNQTIAAYHQMVSYRIQTRKYGKWCLKDAIQMISYTIWATIICKHNLWLGLRILELDYMTFCIHLKCIKVLQWVKFNYVPRQSYLSIKFKRAPMYVKMVKEKLQKMKL